MSWFKQRRQLLILVQKIMTLTKIFYLFWFNCLSRKFNPLIPYSFSISSTVVNCFRHSHSYNIEIYFLTSEQGIKRARRRLKTAWTIWNWFIFFFFFIVEWSTNGTIIWNKTIKKTTFSWNNGKYPTITFQISLASLIAVLFLSLNRKLPIWTRKCLTFGLSVIFLIERVPEQYTELYEP